MTSIGRQASIWLCATLLAGTAGCVASPQYPIAPGQAPGDGALHMTQRPQYPISGRAGAQAAPDVSYTDPQRASPPAPPAPDDDADLPHAAPSAPVDSSSLPPPSSPDSASAPDAGGPHLDYGLAQIPPAFELAAYRHRRHAGDQGADDSKTAEQTKTGRRRRGKPSSEAEPAQAKSEAKTGGDEADAAPPPLEVTVKPGERVAQVAKRLHIPKQALMQVNGIDPSDHVKPGTVLKTPYRYAYQVQKGDTLYAIGHRFGEDTDQLAKLNALKHITELQPGETIELPVAAQDAGTRDHAHGEALTPVGAPDRLIAEQSRKERRAAEREAAQQARRDRRGRHEVQVASADASSADEPVRESSRHHRFTPPPTGMTSANLAAMAERSPARVASAEPERPAERPYVAPPETAPTPARTASASTSYTPAARYTGPIATASTGRTVYGSTSAPVPVRPPVSVASEMAAEAGPSASASSAASPPSAYVPHPVAAPHEVVAPSETGLTSPARPLSTYARTPAAGSLAATGSSSGYAAPRANTYASASASSPSAAAARAPTYAGSTYASSGYAGSTSSAPTRVASLNTPTYGGSIYGGPVLGRPRPVVPTAPGVLSNSAVAAAGQGRFVWPLRGAILEPFGDHGAGLRNDGLDIVAQPGESVHAAAGGEVVYAGSSIPGFGNLILVKHAGGWVTAYAHLDRIEVRMRDTVTQGQEIGQAGQTGAVDRPQLHFEVRYAPQADEKARPVDPALVLPGAG